MVGMLENRRWHSTEIWTLMGYLTKYSENGTAVIVKIVHEWATNSCPCSLGTSPVSNNTICILIMFSPGILFTLINLSKCFVFYDLQK